MLKEKRVFIFGTFCAVLIFAAAVLLTQTFKIAGFIAAALSPPVFAFFYVVFAKKKDALTRLMLFLYAFLLAFAIALIALQYTGVLEYFRGMTTAELVELIQGSKFSEAVFVILQFLQVTFLPLPSFLPTAAGAYIFKWNAVWLSLIGVLAGSALAFAIGRKFGVKAARWIAGPEALEKYYTYAKGRDKTILFLMFLLPAFPDDLLCIIAGLTDMKFRTFMLMMLITRPIQIAATIFAIIFLKDTNIPFSGWGAVFWIGLIALAVGLAIILFKYGKQIEAKMVRGTESLNAKKDELLKKFKSYISKKKKKKD